MIRLQKFKFGKLLLSLITKDTKVVTELLTNYRFCGDGYIFTQKLLVNMQRLTF